MPAVTESAIATAVAYLHATPLAGETLYAYCEEQQPGMVFVNTAEELADLGERLTSARVEKDALMRDRRLSVAYSLWCADTTAASCSALDVVRALPELHETGLDVDGLREQAGAAADWLTVAACTHLEREIRELLSEDDEHADRDDFEG